MKDLCGDKAYSLVWMKQKLKDHYGDSILISELHGKSNVITFRKTAASIFYNSYKQSKSTEGEDAWENFIIKDAR